MEKLWMCRKIDCEMMKIVVRWRIICRTTDLISRYVIKRYHLLKYVLNFFLGGGDVKSHRLMILLLSYLLQIMNVNFIQGLGINHEIILLANHCDFGLGFYAV